MTKAEKLAWIEQIKRIKESVPQVDEAALEAAEAPLVEELNGMGMSVTSVWDLINRKVSYPQAVPILLAHLRKPYPNRILEGIARALCLPEARIGWNQLVSQYCRDYEIDPWREVNELKWSLHLALVGAADESVLDELISLACDRRHGHHRSYFVDALDRIGGVHAKAALVELRGDPELKSSFERLDKKVMRRRRR